METVSRRMDISNIVQRNEYIKLLSKVMLQPYQISLLAHLKEANDRKSKEARELPLTEAEQMLKENLVRKDGDLYNLRVDEILNMHLETSST